MSQYNLTQAQKDLLTLLVRCDEEGKTFEQGFIDIFSGDDQYEVPGCVVLQSRGDLEALCDEQLLRKEQERPHLRYRITNTGRIAVKNNFQVAMRPERPSTPHRESPTVAGVSNTLSLVDPDRIDDLHKISSQKFDLTKLIRLCEELNECYATKCYYAVAMLTRAILDHVPPIFSVRNFSDVANNYSGGSRSFKQNMQHLENSLRKIADAHLHEQIRSREVLPNKTQINFSNDLDVLLGEVVRILK